MDSEYIKLLVVGRNTCEETYMPAPFNDEKILSNNFQRDEAIQHAVRIRSDAGKVVFEPRLIAPDPLIPC